jgi:hypothetical protein
VAGKRLFWISIIMVELVLGYVLWRPVRDRLRPSHRSAVTPAVVRQPEIAVSPAIILPPKPWSGVRSTGPSRKKPPVINASLKTPEPIPAKPLVAPPPVAPLESFWCHISMVQPDCECKAKDGDQTANLVTR